ncbi:MAG: NADH-quinone oxidoreductase subunit NuoN [Burkholderiales bacterium]|nr:NADH-quinone oxidoreductase subunit NuoN [Burkholderiales bacterium]MDP2398434.1 NADH-quinone oxidoreductase subunit NuoN [Burkholderiales bacterium]
MEYITPLWPAYPELFLLVMACIILIADLFISDDNRIVTYSLTQATLASCALLTFFTGNAEPIYTFSGMFVDDLMADALKLLTCVAVITTLVYARAYTVARGMFRGEFFALVLFATLGMMVMISANHLLTLYLGLELLSLSLYAMVALQRDSVKATEAAMKYFVLGALASGMLLYGMSMLYGATGTLEITQLAQLSAEDVRSQAVLVFALVFIVAGLGFKLGAVPFHMWVPDVYQGAPTVVTLFIASAPKFAAFAIVMRLLAQALGADALFEEWRQMLLIMAVLSLAIGNLTAIMQTNLKRMLAYSTISHMGFLLLGVLSGSLDGYGASMFYVVVYVLMTLGAFGVILLLSRGGFEAEDLDDYRGLNQRSPWYAFLMLLLMFSMAGIPPTVGFYAKLSVLQAVVQVGLWWVAVIAVMFSLIGAFYYLRVVKLMYFDAPRDTAPLSAGADMRALLSVNGLAVLVLGIAPQPLMVLCIEAVRASI